MKGNKGLGNGVRSIADIVSCRRDPLAMRLLIEHNVDLTGRSAATFASSQMSTSRFNFLFKDEDERVPVQKNPWTTPLHLACRHGYLDMARIIVEEGRHDTNTPDALGKVALHAIATGSGSLEIAEYLLKMGARVDAADHSGGTPLAAAALHGKTELIRLLIDRGAFIDGVDTYAESAIFNAALQDHHPALKLLVSRGGDVDIRNINGISAFFKAASKLNIKTMDALVACGCDVDSRDNNGCTALVRAVMAKNIILVARLLQLGADIDIGDNDGCTALFVAMLTEDENLIRLLLQSGPGLGNIDSHGSSILHQAALTGSTTVARHILASPQQTYSSQSQLNVFGETALSVACKYDNSAIVRLLLKHGHDHQHIDPNGYRALDRAMYWGSLACVRLLLEAGADVDGRALFSLQQGRHDNPQNMEAYDMIFGFLRPRYPQLSYPKATAVSPLIDLFGKAITTESLNARMHEKQGKPPPPKTTAVAPTAGAVMTASVSPDPFEASVPESPMSQIINHHNLIVEAGGLGALEIGAAGANIGLSIAGAVLGL